MRTRDMSEMCYRVKEFREALHRYLKNNSLDNAGIPLIGALCDLKMELISLDFPGILAAYQIKRGAPAGFFRSQWPTGIIVPDSNRWIHLKGDIDGLMPEANIIMCDGDLYLHITYYSKKTEKALLLLKDQEFLRPVPRNQNWKNLESLPITGNEETALQELFESYNNNSMKL